ncbi:hypothetical protein MRB53_042161 [Persea americana]|nr:hypothetical protein MRB53_042161 [Persea americana]
MDFVEDPQLSLPRRLLARMIACFSGQRPLACDNHLSSSTFHTYHCRNSFDVDIRVSVHRARVDACKPQRWSQTPSSITPRFYVFYLTRLNASKAEIAPYEAVKKSFSTVRKGIRLGKFVEHLKSAAQAVDNVSMDPVLRWCAIGRQLGYAGYLTCDNLGFLDSTGIRKLSDKKKVSELGAKAWLTGISFSTISGIYSLYNLRVKQARIDKTNAEKSVEYKKLEKYVVRLFLYRRVQCVAEDGDEVGPVSRYEEYMTRPVPRRRKERTRSQSDCGRSHGGARTKQEVSRVSGTDAVVFVADACHQFAACLNDDLLPDAVAASWNSQCFKISLLLLQDWRGH